jgi:hypothetical protein
MVLAPGSQSDTFRVKIKKMDHKHLLPQVGMPVVIVEKVTSRRPFAASDNSKSVVRSDGTPV